jgi:hypothetical protein
LVDRTGDLEHFDQTVVTIRQDGGAVFTSMLRRITGENRERDRGTPGS